MPDREKVIKWLESLHTRLLDVAMQDSVVMLDVSMVANAITLLKEQGAVEPIDDGHGSLICGNQGFGCGCVGRYDLATKVVEKYCNFCPECGRKVKWE